MRDRLKELLNEAFLESNDNYGIPNAEQVADHLLANGVISPSCEIGQTVYQIVQAYIVEEPVLEIQFIKTCIKTSIKYSTRLHFFLDTDIGDTVFFTREEAERALANGTTAYM